MVYEQHVCLLDHKDRDGEIDLVVNMRYGMSPLTPSPQCMCSDALSLSFRARSGTLLPLPTAGVPANWLLAPLPPCGFADGVAKLGDKLGQRVGKASGRCCQSGHGVARRSGGKATQIVAQRLQRTSSL